MFGKEDLYVSPNGKDHFTGSLPEPSADGSDGPLASIQQAQRLIRRRKQLGQLDKPLTVWLRGGRYPLRAPLTFTPNDSAPLTFSAYPGEQPIIDGGQRITGWRVEQVNGVTAWVADLPEVAQGQWHFRCLYVNGRRAPRVRLPRENFYWMQEVPGLALPTRWGDSKQDAFICARGEVQQWRNLQDVEVVALHWWIEERLPITSFDPQTQLVKLGRTSRTPLADDKNQRYARYYVENVFEALSEPGQWYLDCPTGRLYYIPRGDEDPQQTEIFAPRAFQLLELLGQPEDNRFVEFLRFEGLTFAHTDWRHPGEDGAPNPCANMVHARGRDGSASQAACDVPGVIRLEGARHCAIVDCTVRNVGWYGIELSDGCHGIHLVGNELDDLGGGGIKINGADAIQPRVRRTGCNVLTDNHIHGGGRVFHSAVGILAMHSFGNRIAHNHIHDLYYSGISCGWVWGYSESVSRDNLIEKNHIHDLGQGWLSDMGGIYTLGVQPGTVIRGNLIHDVNMSNYGAWCIYPDEGSSHLLIEKNICHSTNDYAFHQHYGRENVIRNNVFALGRNAVAILSRADREHRSFTFERNIVVTDGPPLWASGYQHRFETRSFLCDLNCYWSLGDQPLTCTALNDQRNYPFDEWRRQFKQDRHSIVADPRFKDAAGRDFAINPDSPVWDLDFEPIDVSDVGPRPKQQR